MASAPSSGEARTQVLQSCCTILESVKKHFQKIGAQSRLLETWYFQVKLKILQIQLKISDCEMTTLHYAFVHRLNFTMKLATLLLEINAPGCTDSWKPKIPSNNQMPCSCYTERSGWLVKNKISINSIYLVQQSVR